MVQVIKNLPAMQQTWVRFLGREDPLEKEMQSTPIFLPGKSHGLRSLAGPESDMIEHIPSPFSLCQCEGMLVTPSSLILFDPMDCSPPGYWTVPVAIIIIQKVSVKLKSIYINLQTLLKKNYLNSF